MEIFAQVEQRQVMLGRSERLSRRLMRRQVDDDQHIDNNAGDHLDGFKMLNY